MARISFKTSGTVPLAFEVLKLVLDRLSHVKNLKTTPGQSSTLTSNEWKAKRPWEF